MASPYGLDVEAEALRQATDLAGIAYSVDLLSRAGERERPWLQLCYPGRSFLSSRGCLHHAGPGSRTVGPHLNGPADVLTRDKAATLAVLRQAGISVPEGQVFAPDQPDRALDYARTAAQDVCVKPNAGSQGRYVYPGLRDPAAILAAFRKAKRLAGGVLVERSLPGESLRHFFVAPGVVATKCHRGAAVTGDGQRTVAELIGQRNAATAEKVGRSRPVTVNAALHRVLRDQGVSLRSVPMPGQDIALSLVSNTFAGGEARACTDIHPSYAEEVARACAAIPGLVVAAVDMVVLDRTQPASCRNHWVLEVNSSPVFSNFPHRLTGRPDDVGSRILALLAGIGGPGDGTPGRAAAC